MKTDFALLDMDGTILAIRSIDVLCDTFGFTSKLRKIGLEYSEAPRYVVTNKIAALFKGKKLSELGKIFDSIPLNEGVYQLISFLKERGFIIALATDGYKFLADRLKNRLELDLVYGNMLQFKGDYLTGKVLTSPSCLKIAGCREYLICKLRLLKSLKESLEGKSVVIGDSDSDSCMFEDAEISIAYKPKNHRIEKKADITVQNFYEAIMYLKEKLG